MQKYARNVFRERGRLYAIPIVVDQVHGSPLPIFLVFLLGMTYLSELPKLVIPLRTKTVRFRPPSGRTQLFEPALQSPFSATLVGVQLTMVFLWKWCPPTRLSPHSNSKYTRGRTRWIGTSRESFPAGTEVGYQEVIEHGVSSSAHNYVDREIWTETTRRTGLNRDTDTQLDREADKNRDTQRI